MYPPSQHLWRQQLWRCYTTMIINKSDSWFSFVKLKAMWQQHCRLLAEAARSLLAKRQHSLNENYDLNLIYAMKLLLLKVGHKFSFRNNNLGRKKRNKNASLHKMSVCFTRLYCRSVHSKIPALHFMTSMCLNCPQLLWINYLLDCCFMNMSNFNFSLICKCWDDWSILKMHGIKIKLYIGIFYIPIKCSCLTFFNQ